MMRPATGGGPPRYQEIMRAISRDISSGRVAVGARLPTEPELCRKYSVGRHTVREAVRCLVDVTSKEPVLGYRWHPDSAQDIAAHAEPPKAVY